MLGNEASCSDCKLELLEKRWIQLLLNWINRCVTPTNKVRQLNINSLRAILEKYKSDISKDDYDKALLNSEEIDGFIKYKYPIIRLRHLSEPKDLPKKLMIMTSILLYHCCMNSKSGLVDKEICTKMDKMEQEMIVRFCEDLSDIEATISNVESAISDACETVYHKWALFKKSSLFTSNLSDSYTSTSETYAQQSDINSSLTSNATIPVKLHTKHPIKSKTVTVMSSRVNDLQELSDTSSEKDSKVFNLPLDKEPDASNPIKDVAVFKMDGINTCEGTKVITNKNELLFEINATLGVGSPTTEEMEAEPDNDRCKVLCECTKCGFSGSACGDPGGSMNGCDNPEVKKTRKKCCTWKLYLVSTLIIIVIGVVGTVLLTFGFIHLPAFDQKGKSNINAERLTEIINKRIDYPKAAWQCSNNICDKINPLINVVNETDVYHLSLNKCLLLCSGPQLWPYPIGLTSYSKTTVALTTSKLEYKMKSSPSEAVTDHLSEALKLFIADLSWLEKQKTKIKLDYAVKKLNIILIVENDPDPRLRLDTDESYKLNLKTDDDHVVAYVTAASFCGVRHGLETLSQLIVLDHYTGYLITYSNIAIKDSPNYKYRGLMLDTARNFIPLPDIMRTIDAMSMNKLNTFHWRISDVTSFPLVLDKVSELMSFGAYDMSMTYNKEDVKLIVRRANIRGIRVLIEVAAPGPGGRPWSWHRDTICPGTDNITCSNMLCLRLSMRDAIFDILETIYSEIIKMTKVDDIFHLSDGLFSLANCYNLNEDRDGFLEKALSRLRYANNGFMPKLPIIWYTSQLNKEYEANTWQRFGVQLSEWPLPMEGYLSRFKVIQSARWDLTCQMKNQRCYNYRKWQEMYNSKSWRTLDVLTTVGGEAMLWTDLVDSDNLDLHLWPRAAAVAERLWSDDKGGKVASPLVYQRLDSQRWRMVGRKIQVQPVWPLWCTFNPKPCVEKIS